MGKVIKRSAKPTTQYLIVSTNPDLKITLTEGDENPKVKAAKALFSNYRSQK